MAINDFDEARQATESMFAEEPQTEETAVETPEQTLREDTPPEEASIEQQEQPAQSQPTVDEAANIAEAAANAAMAERQANEQNTARLEQLAAENEQLRQTNEELQKTITQQSETQREQIIENAMPELDIDALAFADAATAEKMKADYAAKMREYVMGDIRKEFEPAMEFAKQGMKDRERAEALEILRSIPEMQGIDELLPQMDKIIAANSFFENMPIDEQLINAFAMARGVNAINTPPVPAPKPPTAEELMEFYRNNPEFQQMVDSDRLEHIKQSQQVPPMSASSGAVNAALNIQEKPKTWDDASERTRKMFRADEESR